MEEEGGAGVVPPELWGYIFDFLPVGEVCRLRIISHEWKKAIDQESFWETKVRQDFPESASSSSDSTTSWKDLYQELAGWKWDSSREISNRLKFENNDRTALNPETTGLAQHVISNRHFVIYPSLSPNANKDQRRYYWEITLNVCAFYSAYGIADEKFTKLGASVYDKSNSGIGCYLDQGAGVFSWTPERQETRLFDFPVAPKDGDIVGILVDIPQKRLLFFCNRKPIRHWVDMTWIWEDMEEKGEDERKLYLAIRVHHEGKMTLKPCGKIPKEVQDHAEQITGMGRIE